MGFFKDLIGRLTAGGAGSPADALSALIKGGGTNGLGQLVDHLKTGGLAAEVDSWVSTGVNKAVTSEQVQQAMGSKLGQLASKLGVTPQAAAAQLTSALPSVIDKLTPDGKIPSGTALAAGLKKLKGSAS